MFPESNDELIELLNAGGTIVDWVTLPDETLRMAVSLEGTTELGFGGLCKHCGEFFRNWKSNHELTCQKNPLPDTEAIARRRESERERQARRGNCSECGRDLSYNTFMRSHKKTHDGVLSRFLEKQN